MENGTLINPIFYHDTCIPIHDISTPYNPEDIEPIGWYFWDETWAHYYGPFQTRELAEASLAIYCRECL